VAKRRTEEGRVLAYFRAVDLPVAEAMLNVVKAEMAARRAGPSPPDRPRDRPLTKVRGEQDDGGLAQTS